jgi:hypothetical protein
MGLGLAVLAMVLLLILAVVVLAAVLAAALAEPLILAIETQGRRISYIQAV